MKVTKIEPVTKTKFKVYLDDKFAFVLYKGELLRYKLQEDKEVSEIIYEEIIQEVLVKRAKLRAMHLLNQMDRTENQLRTKLRNDQYPEVAIESAMRYVESFGYIGDAGYAKRFVNSKQSVKSKREIAMLLKQKGVSDEYIQNAIEESYEEEEEIKAIRKLAAKKKYDPETSTEIEKKRIFEYLLRKGFRYEDIRQVIQVSLWNA